VFVSLCSWCFLLFVVFCHLLFGSRLFTTFGSVHVVDRFVSFSVTTASLVVVVGGSYGGSSIHGYRGVRSISTPTPSSYPS
jgi:hypothetical protein